MKHILIIGGTGMLRGATEYFIEQGNIVTLMARNEHRLNAIKQKYPKKQGKILTLSQDFRESEEALKRIKKAGKHKTKKETVTQALIEYIERREQKKIAELFGTIEYDETYSYKTHRSRK